MLLLPLPSPAEAEVAAEAEAAAEAEEAVERSAELEVECGERVSGDCDCEYDDERCSADGDAPPAPPPVRDRGEAGACDRLDRESLRLEGAGGCDLRLAAACAAANATCIRTHTHTHSSG